MRMTISEKQLFRDIQRDDLNNFMRTFLESSYVNKSVLNSEGTSLIGESVKRGAIKIAEFMINNDKSIINSIDAKGNKPLAYVGVMEPNEAMISLFEKYNFDFSSDLGPKGNILHVIAPRGDENLANKVISLCHDDLMRKNSYGEMPTDVAKRWCNFKFDNVSLISNKKHEDSQNNFM